MTLVVAQVLGDGSVAVAADSRIEWGSHPGLEDNPRRRPQPLDSWGIPKLYPVSPTVMVGLAGNHAVEAVRLIGECRSAMRETTDAMEVAAWLAQRAIDETEFLIAGTTPEPSIYTTNAGAVEGPVAYGSIGNRSAFSKYQEMRSLVAESGTAELPLEVWGPMIQLVELGTSP